MHHPLGVARLSCNLPYTFPVLFLPRSVPAFSRSREVWKQGERTESRLESISLLRHQCFTVGTLLIALLYNYSTSTRSVCLWHRSCFQFLSRSPGLHPLFPLPFFCFVFLCYFYPSFCGIKTTFLKVAPKVCMLKPLTSWVTQYLCVYWCYLRCSDILTGSMQSYHILHENENPNQL